MKANISLIVFVACADIVLAAALSWSVLFGYFLIILGLTFYCYYKQDER